MSEQSGVDGQILVDEYMRYRRWGVVLVIGGFILFLVIGVLSSLNTTTLPPLDYSKIGVHLLLDDGRNDWPVDIWPVHLAAAADITADGGIVVQVIRADDLDTERWQIFMDLAGEHNMTPVVRLATTFDHDANIWNAPDADDDGRYTAWGERYANFINGLDWHTDEKHIILLNEPNNGHEWGGQPDAAAYAQFVVDVVAILREEVEGVVILNGAMDLYAPNTGSQPFLDSEIYMVDANTFMDDMLTAQPDIFTLFDKWNSHPYPLGAFVEDPAQEVYRFDFMHDAVDTTTPPPEGIANRGVNGYEWELWKLEQSGISGIPVMITEFGWRHAETIDTDSLDAAENYPDAGLVARYIDVTLRGAISPFAGNITWQPLLADERVEAVAFFALNGVPQEWGHTNWLQLDEAGIILGTYPAYNTVSGYPFEND